jgi:hypothetical protein
MKTLPTARAKSPKALDATTMLVRTALIRIVLTAGMLLLVQATLTAPAYARPGPFPGPVQARLCEEAIRTAEIEHRLPEGLLMAIALKETGRWDKHVRASYAWPWTVTNGGPGKYLPTIASAMRHVHDLQARGESNIDVGCMQVNLHYHGDAFDSLEDAFDPRSNANYAARFLADLRRRHGSWKDAVEHYHSGDEDRGRQYREAVYELRDRVQGITRTAARERTVAPKLSAEMKAAIARRESLATEHAAAADQRKADLARLEFQKEQAEARLRTEFEARKAKVLAAWKEKMEKRKSQQLASAD